MIRWHRKIPRPAGTAGSHMLVIGVTYAIYSLSLFFPGARWHRTPAYRNLLLIMPTGTWGVIFGGTAVLLLVSAYRRHPAWLAYAAILLAFMLTTCWDIAFIVRWITSGSTTPETWTSWAVFNYVLLRAGILIDRERNRETYLAKPPADG